jgi:hypothetical protein
MRRLLPLLIAAALLPATVAGAAPIPTRTVYATGRIVPIPAAVPHEDGDMVDRRIVGDLRWIAARYPIYVTDGYSGPLPNGARVGWRPVTRLAHWAEPSQSKPRAPFRWVGYDGDAGHGCGNHLHLSWEHAPAPMFQLAEWVEVFPVGAQEVATQPAPPAGPQGGAQPESVPVPGGSRPGPTPPKGPPGGISTVQSGGIGAGD